MIQAGSIIGSYRVVGTLGEGGMGTVYLAEHTLLGRRAAVKVLKPALSVKPDVIQRFFGEARTASALADPGIVQIFDFGYHPSGSAYILMELLDGEPLDARIRRLGRLPVAHALRIVRQVASSLAAAHARGIVHRDLKPENIILVRDAEVLGGERAKLLDFGIAKLMDGEPPRPAGPVMGTPLYMSPEQCRDLADLDHRSDVYSLGCVLYHLLVGRPPFEGSTAIDLIAMHLLEPPPVPSLRVPDLPPDVDALVVCCLGKSPRERFHSMQELIAGIGLVLPQLRDDRELAEPAGWRRAPEITLTTHPPAVPAPTTLGTSVGAVAAPAGGRPSRLALLLAAAVFACSVAATAYGTQHIEAMRRSAQPALPDPAPDASPAAAVPRCRGIEDDARYRSQRPRPLARTRSAQSRARPAR